MGERTGGPYLVEAHQCLVVLLEPKAGHPTFERRLPLGHDPTAVVPEEMYRAAAGRTASVRATKAIRRGLPYSQFCGMVPRTPVPLGRVNGDSLEAPRNFPLPRHPLSGLTPSTKRALGQKKTQATAARAVHEPNFRNSTGNNHRSIVKNRLLAVDLGSGAWCRNAQGWWIARNDETNKKFKDKRSDVPSPLF